MVTSDDKTPKTIGATWAEIEASVREDAVDEFSPEQLEKMLIAMRSCMSSGASVILWQVYSMLPEHPPQIRSTFMQWAGPAIGQLQAFDESLERDADRLRPPQPTGPRIVR